MIQSFSKIWIIGILAVVVAGGFFAWQYWAPKPAPVDETANWKTYKNEEYGFEIDYPDFYYVMATNKRNIVFRNEKYREYPSAGDGLNISILDNPLRKSLKDWFLDNSTEAEFGTEEHTQSTKIYYNSKEANPTAISIGGKPALSFSLLGGYPLDMTVILVQNQSSLNLLNILYDKNMGHSILNQMLSTFRFLE